MSSNDKCTSKLLLTFHFSTVGSSAFYSNGMMIKYPMTAAWYLTIFISKSDKQECSRKGREGTPLSLSLWWTNSKQNVTDPLIAFHNYLYTEEEGLYHAKRDPQIE